LTKVYVLERKQTIPINQRFVSLRRIMRCNSCQFENEEGAKFCENCGATLVPVSPHSTVSRPVPPQIQLYCSRCGTPNETESFFCESCGSKLTRPENNRSYTSSEQYTVDNKTSVAWWLMPILLAWIGGLVAWLVVRETNKVKARYMLWLGIAMTLFWPVFFGLLSTCMASFPR